MVRLRRLKSVDEDLRFFKEYIAAIECAGADEKMVQKRSRVFASLTGKYRVMKY